METIHEDAVAACQDAAKNIIKRVLAHVRQHVHGPSIHEQYRVPPLRQGALLGDVAEVVLERHLQF